jgi:hypothetical protein
MRFAPAASAASIPGYDHQLPRDAVALALPGVAVPLASSRNSIFAMALR